MDSRSQTGFRLVRASLVAIAAACGAVAQAQPSGLPAAQPPNTAIKQGPAPLLSMRQVFEAAWARQPEALALQARRDAARSQQMAVQGWTPEPAALELSTQTDRLSGNRGLRELEAGVTFPLWLPQERLRSVALADAEGAAVESRAAAAQLRVAASVRDAWWKWQRARSEADTARDVLGNTQRIAADVARRTKAGDLARADQHQADGAVASAEASLAQADADVAAAQQQLRALTGIQPALNDVPTALAEPDPGADTGSAVAGLESHAALQELKDRAAVAERTAALAMSQSRANPEVVMATTRDRGAFGEASQQTLTLGVRIPFGGGPRYEAKSANARADATEAQAQYALERERVMAEREAARVRVESSRVQLAAAERRAQLAGESRGFFDKSFRLGETDLPTRLRIEAEAAEAERQAARSRIELAAAISAWRQALGLVPD